MEIFRRIRSLSREDGMFLMRYTLGIATEVTVAFLLFFVAKGDFAWAAWIAYLLLISAAVATLIGLSWCWLWLVGRGVGWFVAALLAVVGAWLLTSGTKYWDAIVDLGRHAH